MAPSDGYRKRACELRNLTQIITLSFEEELKPNVKPTAIRRGSFNNSPGRQSDDPIDVRGLRRGRRKRVLVGGCILRARGVCAPFGMSLASTTSGARPRLSRVLGGADAERVRRGNRNTDSRSAGSTCRAAIWRLGPHRCDRPRPHFSLAVSSEKDRPGKIRPDSRRGVIFTTRL